MKRNKLLEIALSVIGGALWMSVLIYLVKLEGLTLLIVFLIGAVILAYIDVYAIYPRIFKDEVEGELKK